MMGQWRDYLLQESKNIPNLIEERAENLGIPEEEYAHIFKSDYELRSEDYFTLYDLRFEGTSNSASTFLEEHMTGKSPSCGYYYLADLLCNTKNRLVITTNFDSLMEDALFISPPIPWWRGTRAWLPSLEMTAAVLSSLKFTGTCCISP